MREKGSLHQYQTKMDIPFAVFCHNFDNSNKSINKFQTAFFLGLCFG